MISVVNGGIFHSSINSDISSSFLIIISRTIVLLLIINIGRTIFLLLLTAAAICSCSCFSCACRRCCCSKNYHAIKKPRMVACAGKFPPNKKNKIHGGDVVSYRSSCVCRCRSYKNASKECSSGAQRNMDQRQNATRNSQQQCVLLRSEVGRA
jgi:hypothetical protein